MVVDLGSGRNGSEPKILACSLVKLGPDRLMATLSDISLQVSQERRLRQADAWFSTLLDKINDYSVVTVTPRGDILRTDEAFARQLGINGANLIGQSLAAILGQDPLDGRIQLDAQFDLALRDGWHLQESWQRRGDGERYWCQRLIVFNREQDDSSPPCFLVVLRDVPRRKATTDDLHRLLTRDHLTGAANRMHFSQTLELECVRWRELGQPLSLVMLDLDHFKSVNDTHGHPVGDMLLRRVAETCAELLPPRGLFARVGGEEFAVLLPKCRQDAAMELAEVLRKAIAGLGVAVPGGWLSTTASIGCATLEEVDGSTDALIELADRRLYEAKKAGRNQVYLPGVSA